MKLPTNKPIAQVSRYCKQKDRYNCGPVAVLNYWKYCDFNVTYSDIKIISKLLKPTRKTGTLVSYMERLLNNRFHKCSWWALKKHLDRGPAIILEDNHYWFAHSLLDNEEGKTVGVLAVNRGLFTYDCVYIDSMKKILKSGEVLLCQEGP